MNELLLRPARPDDASHAGRLIHAAGPTLFNLMFGPRTPEVIQFFSALFRRRANPFSYQFCTLVEWKGEVVGIAIASDAPARRGNGLRMLWLAPRLRGLFALLRQFPKACAVMSSATDTPSGAFYLGILAVDERCRGMGIGSRLLEEVKRQAQHSGASLIALHCELDNDAAQRLYARHGFVETQRKAAKSPHLGVSGFVGMECVLVPEP